MSNYPTPSLPVAQNSADADLLLRIGIALSIRKRAGWHLVRFGVQNGVVRLAGIVPTFYDRQLIVALARHVAGVRRVDDKLAVGHPSLRREVADTDTAPGQNDANKVPGKPHNPFGHLPVVDYSLDTLVEQAASAAVTGAY